MAVAAALAWLTLWQGTASLTPLSTSPTCLTGLIGTVLALALAVRQQAAAARRLDLAPPVRVLERQLSSVAAPGVVVTMGVGVIWYTMLISPAYWVLWGVIWVVRGRRRLTRER